MFEKILKETLGLDCVKEFRFHSKRRWRADYAIPEKKILIEVEGGLWVSGRHNRAAGYIKDMDKYNTATSMGYSILRFTPQQLVSQATLDLIAETIKNK